MNDHEQDRSSNRWTTKRERLRLLADGRHLGVRRSAHLHVQHASHGLGEGELPAEPVDPPPGLRARRQLRQRVLRSTRPHPAGLADRSPQRWRRAGRNRTRTTRGQVHGLRDGLRWSTSRSSTSSTSLAARATTTSTWSRALPDSIDTVSTGDLGQRSRTTRTRRHGPASLSYRTAVRLTSLRDLGTAVDADPGTGRPDSDAATCATASDRRLEAQGDRHQGAASSTNKLYLAVDYFEQERVDYNAQDTVTNNTTEAKGYEFEARWVVNPNTSPLTGVYSNLEVFNIGDQNAAKSGRQTSFSFAGARRSAGCESGARSSAAPSARSWCSIPSTTTRGRKVASRRTSTASTLVQRRGHVRWPDGQHRRDPRRLGILGASRRSSSCRPTPCSTPASTTRRRAGNSACKART